MDGIEKKATEIADNILKAIEPFLSEIKKKNEKIKELEEGINKHRWSKRIGDEDGKMRDQDLYKLVEEEKNWKEWIDKRPRSQVYEE